MGSVLSAARQSLAFATLLVATQAVAEGDRHQFDFSISASYVDATTELESWLDDGLGKLRDKHDGLTAVRLFAEYRGRITPTLHARVVADYLDDGSSGVDLTEAYIDWRPIPRSRNQQQWRFGAFYPALSLENGARGWESPFTYTYSAINTWLGEEIRPVGAEWSLRRRLERFGNAHELRGFAGAFYGNDPAGTLLFWRGWSLHDRQSRLNDRLPIPPAPLRDATGAVTGLVDQPVAPFTETDHRPGGYAGIEWRYARRALVQLARYDNRADPSSFTDGVWGWRTDFNHLAVQVSLPAGIGLVAQWLRGTTDWISGGLPDGTLNPNAELVTDVFDSQFALLTRKFRDRHRLTVRYDDFETTRPAMPRMPDTDAGHAWTLSYRYEPSERFTGGIEWLEMQSRRGVWPFFYGVPLHATDEQVRLQFALRLGAPAGR